MPRHPPPEITEGQRVVIPNTTLTRSDAPAATVTEALVVPPVNRRKGARVHFTQFKWLYLMLLPGLIYFAVFRYGPMGGAIIAFKDYVPFLGIAESPWVGFKHFEDLFASPDFGRIMGNTLILALLSLVVAFPL